MRTSDERSRRFEAALIAIDRAGAREVLSEPAADGVTGLEATVVPALERIGDAWQQGALSLAQLYVAGRIAEEVVAEVAPRPSPRRRPQPRLAMAVLEDHHALGKRLVLSALRAAGYQVSDMGHGLSAAEIAAGCAADRVEMVLVSTLMLPSALHVKELRARLDVLPRRPRLVVGGAPFRIDTSLGQQVGADAAGGDSADALAIVARFAGEAG